MIQKGYQNAIQEYFFQVASALQLFPRSDSVNFSNFNCKIGASRN